MQGPLKGMPKEARQVGMDAEERRAGTFVQSDHAQAYALVNQAYQGKLELLDIRDAVKRYKWLRKLMWSQVDAKKDTYTKAASRGLDGGYFIRILKGQTVELPVQSCLMITQKGFQQRVHNIIIAEEGSRAHIITGCSQRHRTQQAEHIGISEFFIRRNATLNFTMVHNWEEDTLVRPRSAGIVEDNGVFVSNYISLEPVRDIQMYPAVNCIGGSSVARLTSLVYAKKNSLMDIGSKAVLKGESSRAEIISRVIAADSATVLSRGMLVGDSATCRGHLECSGLLLGSSSKLQAVPELHANKYGAELSHEAAVGKIADKELIYLMARGLTQEEATSVIIRGFLDTKILGLPEHLNRYVQSLMQQLKFGSG